jgi:hypothetical protein
MAGAPPTSAPPSGRPYLLAGLAWFVAALVLTASGRLAALRPPGPQLILAGATVMLLVAGALISGFRIWRAGINLRQLVALHLTRFVGIWFLVLYARGELPYAFAVPGGWGDILVATGALVLVLFVPNLVAHRTWLLAWNLLGILDLLYVVGTATRIARVSPESMQALLAFPLGLVPTFLVPLLLVSHVWLFGRMRPEKV